MTTVLALQGLVTFVSLGLRNGPFSRGAPLRGERCVQCARTASHRHLVRSVKEWVRIPRSRHGLGDWLPWTGSLFPAGLTLVLTGLVAVEESAGDGPTLLGVESAGIFAVVLLFLLVYFRRPAEIPGGQWMREQDAPVRADDVD